MRVAVVASSPVPFAPGGAERLWNGLVREINETTSHTADLIKLPVRESPLAALVESYRSFAELDLSGFDRVVTTKYPAWIVGHPDHVVYMVHKLRPVYERYADTGLPERLDVDDPDVRGLQALMRSGHARESLPEFFARFEHLVRRRGAADPVFRVPGPLSREVVRYLDGVALDPRCVRAYLAISRTVASRPDYFPPGVEVRVAYPPSDLGGFARGRFDYFFTASRLVGHKRVGLVVEAMRFVEGDVRLKVAGDGPERERLWAMAASDPRVELLGHVPSHRLLEMYADALAVPFVPRDEDLGYITIEAMRSGKPVVTCHDSGGPTEFVEDGVTGFVAAPEPADVGAALSRLARDPDLASRLGTAAAGRVRDLSWREAVTALLDERGSAPAPSSVGPLPRAAAEPESGVRQGDAGAGMERERAILRRHRGRLLDAIAAGERELGAAREEARRLRDETRRLKARLQAVYATRTWRLRRRFLPLVRALARPLRGSSRVRSDGDAAVEPASDARARDASSPRPVTIEPSPGGPRTSEAGRAIVAFFPDIRDRNPYQTMLYGKLEERGAAAQPVDDPVELAASAGGPRPALFHLHWTTPILRGARTEEEAIRRCHRFAGALDAMRAQGTKIVWTVHNVLPHECRFPHIEAELCQEVANRADVVHVMCERTIEAVSPHYVLPPARVRVVPHGSYVGMYPDAVSQREARAHLGLAATDTVLCFLGGIRPYKGLARLLDAFEVLAREKPETRLVVAGPPGRFEGLDDLVARCEANPAIVARVGRVPDEDLQIFMKAADAVVLPHRLGLNSGALMLALSFARPIIAPRIGCIGEIVTANVGITFDPDSPGGLEAALVRAGELKDPRYREAARAKALAYSHETMASDFADLVADLVGDPAGRGRR